METGDLIKWLIVLLVISAIGIGILTVYEKIKRSVRKLRTIKNSATAIVPLILLAKKHADLQEEPPKSVSSLTRIMEPQIMKDFPEFSWEEFKYKAENMLTSALLAISANDVTRLVDASDDITKQVSNIIEGNRLAGIGETFSDIQIHQTEIANYSKSNGKCVITIQCAVGYFHYKVQNGKVIAGDKQQKTQTKYNVELIYIQDAKNAGSGNAVGTTCPQCGAPIVSLGSKKCEYCGGGVEPINIRVWSLHKFYEVDYN